MEKKRIFAWVLLIGFVLLLLNLIVFRFYWQLSMVVYLVIVFAFLLTNGRLVNLQDDQSVNNPQDIGRDDADAGAENKNADADDGPEKEEDGNEETDAEKEKH